MIGDDELFKIISDQNDLSRIDPERYLHRGPYLEKLKKMVLEKGIVIIQGPRRSGKTTLMKLLIKDMLGRKELDPESVIYVNLEDFRLSSNLEIDLIFRIIDLHRERIKPTGKILVMIDEIQNIKGFEKYLRTSYDNENDIKFMITGSNSSLLSKEFGTLLTGRTNTLNLHPFSFKEFMRFKVGARSHQRIGKDPVIMNGFLKYLKFGGIPEFLEMDEPSGRQREYIDQVLFRDIMNRYKLRNERLLRELTRYLMTHSASRISISRLSRTFGVSKDTIMDYLSYLEQSYLIHQLKEYFPSAKEMIRRPPKMFSLDPGLVNSILTSDMIDSGMILENVVFLHLKMSGHEIYFNIDPVNGLECDFLIKEGLKIVKAIQVARELDDPKTFKREVNGVIAAAKRYNLKEGIILNMKKEGYVEIDGIKVIYKIIPQMLLEMGS